MLSATLLLGAHFIVYLLRLCASPLIDFGFAFGCKLNANNSPRIANPKGIKKVSLNEVDIEYSDWLGAVFIRSVKNVDNPAIANELMTCCTELVKAVTRLTMFCGAV